MIRPCNDFVLLEKEKAEEKTASGIILTDKNTEKPTVGKVLAVNNGHEVDGKHVECASKSTTASFMKSTAEPKSRSTDRNIC